jgi:hypothetical protein
MPPMGPFWLPQFVKNNRSPESIRRFQQLGPLFKKYADQYEFPWLLIAAEAFQESGLNHEAKSPVGATGVMQVMPSTAATPPVSIPDVSNVESNINAGVKLLKFIRDDYFKDDPMEIVNKSLMTLAACNAGPARLKQCRELAATQGLDPNLWFNNVEYTVARRVGAETSLVQIRFFRSRPGGPKENSPGLRFACPGVRLADGSALEGRQRSLPPPRGLIIDHP